MGYEEVLKILEKQVKQCQNKQEYLRKQKKIAISNKDIVTEIGINIASVAVQIRKMIKRDQIKCIKGLSGHPNSRHYVLSEEYIEEEKLLK